MGRTTIQTEEIGDSASLAIPDGEQAARKRAASEEQASNGQKVRKVID